MNIWREISVFSCSGVGKLKDDFMLWIITLEYINQVRNLFKFIKSLKSASIVLTQWYSKGIT